MWAGIVVHVGAFVKLARWHRWRPEPFFSCWPPGHTHSVSETHCCSCCLSPATAAAVAATVHFQTFGSVIDPEDFADQAYLTMNAWQVELADSRIGCLKLFSPDNATGGVASGLCQGHSCWSAGTCHWWQQLQRSCSSLSGDLPLLWRAAIHRQMTLLPGHSLRLHYSLWDVFAPVCVLQASTASCCHTLHSGWWLSCWWSSSASR
jgi:hypothetical protein